MDKKMFPEKIFLGSMGRGDFEEIYMEGIEFHNLGRQEKQKGQEKFEHNYDGA